MRVVTKFAIRIINTDECYGSNRRKLFAICEEKDVTRFRSLAQRSRSIGVASYVSVLKWN